MAREVVVSALIASSLAAPALAAEETSTEPGALQEVIVTAQRRQQNLEDVPISLSAFKGDDLTRLGATGAADYLAMTPNVGYSEDANSGSRGVNLSIRGVSDLKTGEDSVTPSIGVYLDGFSVADSPVGLYNPQMADLDQVEVLRGPQGTYYGKNSLGGALNLTTKKPTNRLEGYVSGNFVDFTGPGVLGGGTAVLNVPITGALKTRSVLYYEHSTGIVKNVYPGGAGSGHTYWMGRSTIEWDIDDSTTLSTMVMYDHYDQLGDESVPSGVWSVGTVDGYGLGVTNLTRAVNPGIGFWPQNTTLTDHSGPEFTNMRQLTAISNFSHQFSDSVALKSVVGLLHGSLDHRDDDDGLGGWNNFYAEGSFSGTDYSGEVRLEVNTQPITWITGIIYSKDQTTRYDYSVAGSNTAETIDENGLSPTGVALLPPIPPNSCFSCDRKDFTDTGEALFSELTWRPFARLDLIAGGRFTHDAVDHGLQLFGPILGAPGYAQTNATTGDTSYNDFSPKVGLVYKATPDVRYYATVSKGYKAGGSSLGFNPPPTTVPLPANISVPFRRETLWSYETGIKSEWFDHRLRINASAFYLHWTDLQMEVFRFLVPGNLSSKFALTGNFPSAQARGGELELAAAVTRGFSVSASLGYLDSRILDSGEQLLSGGFNVNLAGLPMPNSPHFTANLAAEERWAMGSGDAWMRGDYVHRGSQYSNVEALVWQQIRGQFLPDHPDGSAFLPATPNGFPFRVPAYDVVNMSAGYDWHDLEAMLTVVNLFGENYYTGTAESFSITGIKLKPHPRAVGLTLTYKFGK
jgi:iron complex outermembrane recepter protein